MKSYADDLTEDQKMELRKLKKEFDEGLISRSEYIVSSNNVRHPKTNMRIALLFLH